MLKVATKLGSFQHNRTGAKMAQFFVLRFSFFFFNFMYLGIYFLWLWRAGASHCGGFSLQGRLLLQSLGSRACNLQ